MTKAEKIERRLNDEFSNRLRDAVEEEFGVEIETSFDIFGSMRHVSTRVDGEDFEPGHKAFMAAFEKGYLAAMDEVEQA